MKFYIQMSHIIKGKNISPDSANADAFIQYFMDIINNNTDYDDSN